MTQELNLYIMSDSVGETGLRLAQAVAAQFPEFEAHYVRFPFIHTKEKIYSAIDEAKKENALAIMTFVTDGFAQLATHYAKDQGVIAIDVMSPILSGIKSITHE